MTRILANNEKNLVLVANGFEYDFGIITAFNDAFSKSVSTTPIVSLSTDNTFALESGSSIKYSVSFSRMNPTEAKEDIYDSRTWSNAKWVSYVSTLANRWQAKSDGYKLYFNTRPYVTTPNPNYPSINGQNVYINSLDFDYEAGYVDKVSGTMRLTVGGLCLARNATVLHSQRPAPRAVTDHFTSLGSYAHSYEPLNPVKVSDYALEVEAYKLNQGLNFSSATFSLIEGGRTHSEAVQAYRGAHEGVTDVPDYLVYLNDTSEDRNYAENPIDVVSKYHLTGGPESPFESLTVTIPRKKLLRVYPELVQDTGDSDDQRYTIQAGLSRLTLNAVGTGHYTVTSCKLSGSNYIITAYCDAEKYKSFALSTAIKYMPGASSTSLSQTPLQAIFNILSDATYGVRFTEDQIICNADDFLPQKPYEIPAGTNVWTIIQMLGYLCNARVFFANDKAYIIDYTKLHQDTGGEMGSIYISDILELYDDPTANLSTTETSRILQDRIADSVSMGNEGISTVVNRVSVSAYDENGRITTYVQTDIPSVTMFGLASSSYDLSQIFADIGESQAELANRFATCFLKYRCDPQESIGFTVNERSMEDTNGLVWTPAFSNVCAVKAIHSTEDEIYLTNASPSTANNTRPQRLMLSQYTRNYPEGSTDYWFGIANSIDLASSTSQILTRLG